MDQILSKKNNETNNNRGTCHNFDKIKVSRMVTGQV